MGMTLNEKLDLIIEALHKRLGRIPTEAEAKTFIFGTEDEQNAVWNSVD